MIARRAPVVAASLVLGGALARGAPPGGEPGAVVVTGDAARADRAAIAAAAEAAARAAGWVIAAALPARDVEVIEACLTAERPWPCLEPVARAHGVGRVLVIHAGPERDPAADDDPGAAPQLVLTGQLVIAGNGVPVIARRYCARCRGAARDDAATALTRALLRDSAARAAATAATAAGTTPAAPRAAAPRDSAPTAPHAPTDLGRRITALILVGGGAIAAAGGTYASLTATSDPHGPQRRHDYSLAGIGVAISGAALLAAGVAWWRWPRPAQQPARSSPTLSLTPGGVAAGWATRL